MKNYYRTLSGLLRRAKAFAALFSLVMMLGFSQQVFAEANYVYHEQTTNNPGCGPNYMSTTSPTNAAGVQLAWKIEYQFYTTNTVVYYTTDGSTPSGAFGVGTGTTQVLTGSYNCTFPFVTNVDVATATIPAQAAGKTVKYIISSWHSGGGNEIFANGPGAGCGCGTPTNSAALATVFTYTVAASNNVEVTSTGGTALASYATLKGAFDAVNAGTHTGSITVKIYGNTTETATAALNASGTGSASYTSMSIQPAGGAARSVSGAITAGSPMIDFNGADNVTVDGLNSGGNALTFSNTTVSATSGTATIRFQADATNNTITKCSVLGSATMAVGTNGGNISFQSAAITTGNDNNTISFCDLGPAGANLPSKCIHFSGTSNTDPGTANSGITITGNNIFDYFSATVASAGIDLNSGTVGTTISNNKFYQTATRTQTTGSQHNAIRISNTSGNAYQITGNTIGFASSTGTGTYTFVGVTSSSVFIPIFLSVGTTTASSVQGNTIAGINFSGPISGTSSSASFRGIYVSSGLTTIGDVTGNTIGSMSTTGSIVVSSSSTSSTDVIAMFNFGSSNWTTNNNNIGGITGSNTSTGATNVYGLRCNTSSTATWSCLNNTIGGTIANSIQSTTTSTSSIVNGILNSSPIGTFTGNTVRNLTAAGGTGTTSSASVIGICITASSANHTVGQNTIFNLSNSNTTAATVVTGIQYTASTGTNIIERNNIYALTSATNSTSAEINGIRIAGGTTTYRNNMIALGAGVSNAIGSAASNSGTTGIVGINEALGTNNIWHNNIYIGGTATAGTGASYAFNGVQTVNTRSFRDNVFVNARTNSGATGKHYAVKINGTTVNPTGLTINNNIYYAPNTGGVIGFFNSLDVASLGAWQTAVGQDAGSFSSDPAYIDPTNATPDLHISAVIPTQVESNGFDVGVTNDYDNQTRSGLTPTDIGADAGNFTLAGDINAPSITYTLISGTCSTGDQTLTATITDASGVPTTGSLVPRVYFKKNAGSYTSAAGTLTAGTGTSGTWSFTISAAAMGGLSGGDVVSYYVIAQDIAGTPNIASNPSGVIATNVNTITTHPSSPNTFAIGIISGTYTVGVGGNFTTLTAAVAAYNAGCIGGPIVFNLIDATYPSETFPITVNAVAGSSSTNTLTIKPNTTATISGSSASSIIKLNGADYIIIDGSNAGGTDRSLTITNTNTSAATAAIWVASTGVGTGATNNIVKNVNISCGADQSTGTNTTFGIIENGAISITGTTPQQDNDNNTYQNNAITKARYGIFSIGESSANPNQNLMVTNNLIGPSAFGSNEIGKGGVVVANANAATIAVNEIRFVGGDLANTSSGTDRAGISFATDASWTPSSTTVTNSTIARNNIHDIIEERTFSAVGVIAASSALPSNNTIANNMIYNVRSDGTGGDQAVGIGISAGSGDKIVYNSISLTGDMDPGAATSASTSAAGIRISSTSVLNLTAANNVVSVDVTSNTATLKHYAYVAPSAFAFGTGFTNYNDLYVNAANTQMVLGGIGTSVPYTDKTTLAAWQTSFTPSQEANSKTDQPVFISSTDLHLNTTSNNNLNAAATPIAGVTTDYDNGARDATTPDMGADEFVPPTVTDIGVFALVSPAIGTGCYSATETFSISVKNFGTVAWDFAAVNASITASVSGAATGSYPLTIIDNSYNGGVPLAAGASMTVTLGTLDMMLPGTYTFNASISAAGDALATNDAMTATDRTSTNPTVSLAGTSPVCEGGTITLTATSSGGTLPGTVSGTNTTPAAIPDNTLTGVASTIAISAPASTVSAATQLAVGLNVSGTFNADVDAYLIGPGGCGTIELTTDNGSSGDGFNITLYNSGAFPSVTTLPTTGTPTGNYLMEGTTSTAPATLSGTGTANYPSVVYTALNGCPINGTWTLFAGDDASGDTHTVQNWSLSITQPGLGTYTNTFSGPGTFGTTTYSGANNSTGTTTVTGLAPGTYTFNVTATDATGCTSISSSTSVTVDANTTYYADADGDTYGDAAVTTTTCDGITPSGYVTNNTDCDDTNSAINPGAAEICNGIDDDCDGSMDEGLTFVTYYADADGDTYGDATSTVSTCDGMPMGYVADNTDCDDTNADINPAATEICNAIDDDCDGSVDEGLTYYTYYADAEGDGFGDPFSSISSCSVTPPSGYVTDNSDCQPLYITYNDLDGDSFGFGDPVPCGSVINNVDCDDTQWLYYDADGDGYGAGAPIECGVPTNTDCAPFNGAIYPGATELCNGIDDDCDGSIDNGLLVTYYADTDGDTYGDPFNSVTTCSGAPVGYVLDNTDCEDIDADIHPGATEVCNGLDDDCNGLADDGLVFITYYSDSDGDGYGDPLSSSTGCSAPVGFVTDNTDCNDANAAINPGATEICNGIDDDCDGTADDGLTFTTYYVDVDGDGYGNPAVSVSTCDGAPFGYVTDNTDCEDNIFEVNPATVWYLDNDADLYYTGTGVTSCTSPGPGYVYAGLIGGGDCNDGDTFINPGATEICNGIDDDCNGSIDDGLTFITYYADADGDTYGDAGSSVSTCDGVPMGYVADNTDCNDSDAAINPAATEICNGIDDDCDGSIDEGLTFLNYYVDADGDGYGDASASPVNSCSPVAGYVTNNLDCNDSNNLISPAGTEICNGVDDNCDGTVDDGILYTIYYADADGDTYGDAGDAVSTCDGAPMGYVADNTDCNDANAAVNPGATEICNGIDDDCDGSTDEGLTFTTYYADVDGDTYGDAFNTTTTCDGIPSGYVVDNTDCDDTQNTVYPGAPEICDGLDNDCDGEYDEGTVTATVTPSGTIAICKGDPTALNANTGVGYTYQWFKNGNVIVGATGATYFATKPGNYQVQVNIPEGCFALSAPTTVQVNPQPNANISAPNGTSLCTTVKLKASYDATYTWQWYKNGSPVGGATSYLYIATTPGSYECVITNAFGCTRTTAAITVTACREGETVETAVEETFELYPNPTESIFTLDMELNSTEQEASVYILSLIGEQVYAGTVGVDHGTVNTTITLGDDVAAGMYVVKVIVAEKEYTKQLMIQK